MEGGIQDNRIRVLGAKAVYVLGGKVKEKGEVEEEGTWVYDREISRAEHSEWQILICDKWLRPGGEKGGGLIAIITCTQRARQRNAKNEKDTNEPEDVEPSFLRPVPSLLSLDSHPIL